MSREEKDMILGLLPDKSDILDANTDDARPDVKKLLNNDNFSHDVAHYQRDLREGHHDPEWIRQAQAAHGLRAAGHYDAFMAAKFEEDWEIKMPGYDGEKADGADFNGASDENTKPNGIMADGDSEAMDVDGQAVIELAPTTVSILGDRNGSVQGTQP
jgi:hypothetical protein